MQTNPSWKLKSAILLRNSELFLEAGLQIEAEAGALTKSTVGLKNVWSFISTTLTRLHDVVLKQSDKFKKTRIVKDLSSVVLKLLQDGCSSLFHKFVDRIR